VETIDPNTVRFTQSSIRATFRNGGTIDQLAEGLRLGSVDPATVPPIRLFEREGKLFTLDNRRLEAFRRANVTVPFRMATPEEVEAESWKFTTQNEGASIRVR
jgi:hypothetical protein